MRSYVVALLCAAWFLIGIDTQWAPSIYTRLGAFVLAAVAIALWIWQTQKETKRNATKFAQYVQEEHKKYGLPVESTIESDRRRQ